MRQETDCTPNGAARIGLDVLSKTGGECLGLEAEGID